MVKIAGDGLQAAVMTGARLAEQRRGLVTPKVIARPGEACCRPAIQAPSPTPDVAVAGENAAYGRPPLPLYGRVTCNLCLDPHCPDKGVPLAVPRR